MNEKKNWTDKLSHAITLAGTAILMNLMFWVAALPIVTIGPAWCALMTSIRYNIRGDGWFAGFKKGYCTRFWRSIISWCLCLAVCLFFFIDFKLAVDTVQGTLNITSSASTAATAGADAETTDPTASALPETTEQMATDANEELIEMGPTVPNIVNCVISGLFFAMACMLTVSLLTLNVYIPTSVSNWIKNGVNFFRHPLELLVAAALFWAPPLLLVFFPEWVAAGVTIFIAAYFALAAVCGTMVLKEPLIGFLIDARADGTLIAEEGSQPLPQEEE